MTSALSADTARPIAEIRALLDRGPTATPTVDAPPRRWPPRWLTPTRNPRAQEGPTPWPSS